MGKTLKIVAPVYNEGPQQILSGLETFIFDVAEISVFQSGTHCFAIHGYDKTPQCVVVAALHEVMTNDTNKFIGVGIPHHRMHYSDSIEDIEKLQKAGQPVGCKYMTMLLDNKEVDFLAVDSSYQVYLLNEQGDTMQRLA